VSCVEESLRQRGNRTARGDTKRFGQEERRKRSVSDIESLHTLMKVLIIDVVESKLHSLVWNVDQSSSDTNVLVVIFDLEVSQ